MVPEVPAFPCRIKMLVHSSKCQVMDAWSERGLRRVKSEFQRGSLPSCALSREDDQPINLRQLQPTLIPHIVNTDFTLTDLSLVGLKERTQIKI